MPIATTATRKLVRGILIILITFDVALARKIKDADPFPSVITNTSGNPLIKLKFFAPLSGFILPLGHLCTEDVRIAIDTIQKSHLLKGYDLRVEISDTQFKIAEGVNMVMEYVRNLSEENTIPVMLGPICEAIDYVGPFLKHYNMILITNAVPSIVVYRQRTRYESLMLIRGSPENWYNAHPSFLADNGWKNIYTVTDAEYKMFGKFEEVMLSQFANYNLTMAGAVKLKYQIDQLPSEDDTKKALTELSLMNARIVFLHSNFPSLLACQIHELGLYGPAYVYLVPEPLGFMPNTHLRYEYCTPEMLADVLQSVIYFSWATPSRIFPDGVKDVVGMTGSILEKALNERIENPGHKITWNTFRSACYTTVLTMAVALDRMHMKLEKEGKGGLTEWSTGGHRFTQNGTYFHDSMVSIFNQLKFANLDEFDHLGFNNYKGMTGYYQPKQNRSVVIVKEDDWPGAFYYIPIAWYNDSKSNARIELTSTEVEWRTKDGLPPLDSIRIISVYEPHIHISATATLFTLAAINFIAVLLLFAYFVHKKNSSTPVYYVFMYFLFGLVLASLSSLTWPLIATSSSGIQCMSAVIVGVLGLSSMAIGSLVIQYHCVSNISVQGPTSRFKIAGKHRTLGTKSISVLEAPKWKTVKKPSTNSMPTIFRLALPLNALLQLAIVAIWFGLYPVETIKVQNAYVVSDDSVSIAYQKFSFECLFSKVEYFAVPLLVLYALLSIRAVHLSFSLAKVRFEEDIEHIVSPIRISSQMVPFILAAGGVSIFSGTEVVVTSSVVTFLIGLLTLIAILKATFFGNKRNPMNPAKK